VSVYANGFVAYHVEVRVERGEADSVKREVATWKHAFREAGTWPGFPASLCERLRGVAGVVDVVAEGPQSAVLIPLRMVYGMTGLPCTLSAVLGTGPVTDAIMSALDQWRIGLEIAKRLPDADAPLEFSFRDPDGEHASLRLYPASRARYRVALQPSPKAPGCLLLNRFNAGLQRLAQQVVASDGLVSLRPRELGRHDRVEDYVALLGLSAHLVLSSRHGVLREFARHAGIAVGRGWPDDLRTLNDPGLERLAAWLLERMPAAAIVVLHRYPTGDSAFWRGQSAPQLVPAPAGFDKASRAARVQGALLGAALQAGNGPVPGWDDARWQRWCQRVVETAFAGTDSRPWIYPADTTAHSTC
jgi:hypothetical protein